MTCSPRFARFHLAALTLIVTGLLTACGGDGTATETPASSDWTTIELTDVDGATFTLADLSGTPVLVENFATWCSNCLRQLGDTQQAAAAAGESATFVALCGLCDITHGSVRERPRWKACRAGLPVPFETFHLDDQPDEIRPLTSRRTPAVLADTAGGPVFLLGPEDLDECASSPDALVTRLEAALREHGLSWP